MDTEEGKSIVAAQKQIIFFSDFPTDFMIWKKDHHVLFFFNVWLFNSNPLLLERTEGEIWEFLNLQINFYSMKKNNHFFLKKNMSIKGIWGGKFFWQPSLSL